MKSNYINFFKRSPLASVITDERGVIRDINESAMLLLNKKKDDVVGLFCDRIFGCVNAEKHEEKRDGKPCSNCNLNKIIFDALREKGSLYDREVKLEVEGEGGIKVKIYNVSVLWLDDNVLMLSFSDITDSRLVEKELRALFSVSQIIFTDHSFTTAARHIFDACCRVTGAVSGYVALLSETGEENEVLFLEAGGLPCLVDPSLPMPIRGLRGEAYANATVVYNNDFMNSKWVSFMPKGHVNMKNVMFAPLCVDGKVIGVMGLANKPSDFTAHDAYIAGIFADMAALALRRVNTEESLRNEIISKNKDIEKARALQKNLNTEKLPVSEGIVISAVYMPSEALSGDFFNVYKRKKKTVILMGDSTGHGIEAAMDSTLLKSICDRYIEDLLKTGKTDQFLSSVNVDMNRYVFDGKYPTMFVCVVDESSDKIYYSNAGFPLPRILDGKKNKTFDAVKGFHLGFDKETYYEMKNIKFENTCGVVLYSDALFEVEDAYGNFITSSHVKQILTSSEYKGNAYLKNIIKSLKDVAIEDILDDDLTVVLIERKTPITLQYNLNTYKEVENIRPYFEETLLSYSYPEESIACLSVVLHEIGKNAFEHGNKGDTSKNIFIELNISCLGTKITVKDEGKGFDVAKVGYLESFDTLLSLLESGDENAIEHGRGVWLVRQYMDSVKYNSKGNSVTVSLNLKERDALFL